MSEHFLCDEMLDVGEQAEKLAEQEDMPRRNRPLDMSGNSRQNNYRTTRMKTMTKNRFRIVPRTA